MRGQIVRQIFAEVSVKKDAHFIIRILYKNFQFCRTFSDISFALNLIALKLAFIEVLFYI